MVKITECFQRQRCMNIEIQKGKTGNANQQEHQGKSSFLVAVLYKTFIIQQTIQQ